MVTLMLSSKPDSARRRGFALVITISLMVLLSLLAVGLLSLSSVSLRGASRQEAMAEARANARLALTLAIGELQKELGPDQRISASASILASEEDADGGVSRGWVGVWNSWEGENRYLSSVHGPSDLVPDLSDHRRDSFRRWLVSSPAGKLTDLDAASATGGDEAVELVGPGTLGAADDEALRVSVPRVVVSGRPDGAGGGLSWWVCDQSQKGLIRAGRADEDLEGMSAVMDETESPSSIGEEFYEAIGRPLDPDELRRAVVSAGSLELVTSAEDVGRHFHDLTTDARSVLADVREGGLKRDLNLLADRYDADFSSRNGLPLSEDYMLYDFGELHRVPLHDLLTYYSLYKARPAGSRGALVASGRDKPYVPSISAKEWSADRNALTTNLYRQPVMVKLQLAIWARAEKSGSKPERPYRLKLRFSPILTLWNPYNVPLTLNSSGSDGLRVDILGISADIAVWPEYVAGSDRGRESSSLGGLTTGRGDDASNSEELAKMVIEDQIVFAPGEVRVFSLDKVYESLTTERELKPGYWPISGNEVDYYDIRISRGGSVGVTYDSDSVTFKPDQMIGVGFAGGTADTSVTDLKYSQGVSIEVRPDYPGSETSWRTQALYSRRAPMKRPDERTAAEMNEFNQLVFGLGSFLDGEELAFRGGEGGGKFIRKPYSIRNLESPEGEMVAVFSYGVAGEDEVISNLLGRNPRFPCRPFLHSLPTVASPWIQDVTTAALYNLGWNWRIEDGEAASNEIVVDGVRGRFGGGWSAAYGQDRVVQYEIPQRPFHSLAHFAHASLGGWSIARNHPTDQSGGLQPHETTTAHGQGGLFPAVSMPVGNSYAHPLIPKDQAFTTWNTRKYHDVEREEPFVDHSYLANYALWDEYFMSSIADRKRGLHESSEFEAASASQLAEAFFGDEGESLPNHRFVPVADASWSELRSEIFRGSRPDDRAHEIIARYLLLDGGFNVNSTSVAAWESLFASLKGRPTLSIPGDADSLRFETRDHDDETPVVTFGVGTDEAIPADSDLRSDGFAPEQWTGSFTLNDGQIRELAEAMVEEVRKRGPFLSLSDFMNRRLDSDSELALKRALQAAIDEAGLNRQVDSSRTADMGRPSYFMATLRQRDRDPIEFREAAEGAVIQGSTAYIDQADILRSIDTRLVPRGDTFVVRTCGESTDANGEVVARAYCEAVVQRMPAYLDEADDPEVKAGDLSSPVNQRFGRQLRVVSFRWLSPDEV